MTHPLEFSKDPIHCIVNGDWLHADRTTLGTDDGIAIALALALVDFSQVSHPPLELLFTVEGEIGIAGAAQLQKEWINGKILVNLDSESEGTLVPGQATQALASPDTEFWIDEREEKARIILHRVKDTGVDRCCSWLSGCRGFRLVC